MILRGVIIARWRMVRNGLLGKGRARAKGPRAWIGLVLLVAFAALVFLALSMTFAELAAHGLGATEAGGALALVLTAAVIGLLIFDLHYAVSSLLLDSDLELLRRAPIGATSLLLLKLADSLPRTSTLLVVLGLPAVFAFATVHPLPGWIWLAVPILLVALWAIPLGAGTALALGLVRMLPPLRARDVLGLLSSLVIAVLWIGNSFLLPRLAGMEASLAESLGRALHPSPWTLLSPPHWAARSLVAAHEGRALAVAGWTALLVSAMALSVAWAVASAARNLETALAHIALGGASGRAQRERTAPRPPARPRHLIATLVARDARLFTRDWTVLSDVVTAAALWTLLPLLSASLETFPAPLMARAMLLALTVGLGYEVAARSVPFERDGLAWVRLSPVSPWLWVVGKLTGAGLLSLALLGVAAATLAFTFPLTPAQWLETTLAGAAALLLSLSLGLWSGARFGDPKWTNPRAMLTLTGRLVASGLLIVQAGVWLGILAWADLQREQLPPSLWYWGPLALAATLSALPLARVARWAGRFEWAG